MEFSEDDLLVQASCSAVSAVLGSLTMGGRAFAWRQHFERAGSEWVLIGETVKEFDEKEAPAVKSKKFVRPPTHVGVVIGRTVNMGDFESVKVGVLVLEACEAEDRDETYEEVLAWVSAKVKAEVVEAIEAREASVKGRSGGRRGR